MLLTLVVVTILGAVGVGRVGDAAVRRARVDAVADMTALAAVDGDLAVADRVARVSGARVVASAPRRDGGVEVTVELGGVRSRAAAAPEVNEGPVRAPGDTGPRR